MSDDYERYLVAFVVGLFLLFIGSMLFNYQKCNCNENYNNSNDNKPQKNY